MPVQYTIIEYPVTKTSIPLVEYNVLVSSTRLSELIIWEQLLDQKGLDYCIAYSEDEYLLFTDMGIFNELSGLHKRSTGIADVFDIYA